MAITLEYLKSQLAASEKELEVCKANYFRVEGSIMLAKHLIADLEREVPVEVTEDASNS